SDLSGLEFFARATTPQVSRHQSLQIGLGQSLIGGMDGGVGLLCGGLATSGGGSSSGPFLQFIDPLVESNVTEVVKRWRLQSVVLTRQRAFQKRLGFAEVAGAHVFRAGVKSVTGRSGGRGRGC